MFANDSVFQLQVSDRRLSYSNKEKPLFNWKVKNISISSPQSFLIIVSIFRSVVPPMRKRTQFLAILFSKMGTLFRTTPQSSYIEVSEYTTWNLDTICCDVLVSTVWGELIICNFTLLCNPGGVFNWLALL